MTQENPIVLEVYYQSEASMDFDVSLYDYDVEWGQKWVDRHLEWINGRYQWVEAHWENNYEDPKGINDPSNYPSGSQERDRLAVGE